MRYLLFGILLIIVIGCKDQSKSVTTKQYKTINDFSASFPDSTELSLAFINGNEVSYFGFIKTSDSLIPVNNYKNNFAIGSISKLFTATLLAKLVTDSIINIDESIENHIDFKLNQSGYNNSRITFKGLANHTSGFPRLPNDYIELYEKPYNKEYVKNYLENKLQLIYEPGNGYSYSNLGYVALGYTISKIQKSSYEELLQQEICTKYGLKNTTTDYSRTKNKVVAGRDSLGNIIPHYDLGIFYGCGNIYSNVIDLSKYIQANFYLDKILDYQRKETYRRENNGVALGWEIQHFGGEGCSWYYHGGGLVGYRSACIMNHDAKCGVIILSNVSIRHKDSDNIVKLAFELIKQEYLQSGYSDACTSSFLEIALQNGWGKERSDSLIQHQTDQNSIVGSWQHYVNNRKVTITFFEDNKVQTDFYQGPEIDVWGNYEINDKGISFHDIGGAACHTKGVYEYEIKGDTLSFKEISDKCGGRKTSYLLDWVRVKQ
jgi:CubicO group peptidase (beta-lactamase class C family)